MPLKKRKKNSIKPWLNKQLFKEIGEKRRLWDKYTGTKDDCAYRNYPK